MNISVTRIAAQLQCLSAHSNHQAPKRDRSFITPPPPSPIFTGRESIISKLQLSFVHDHDDTRPKKQNRFVLCGPRGSGKTQIVLKFIESYCYQCVELFRTLINLTLPRFSRMYLIKSNSLQSVTTAIEDIGAELGLPRPSVSNTRLWLSRANEDWLLVFDGADDPSINLHDFIPPCNHGNIIITTRNRECINHAPAPQSHAYVGEMQHEECVELLKVVARVAVGEASEADAASVIVEELGCIPATVVQAGMFIANSPGVSFGMYLDMYRTNRGELLKLMAVQSMDAYGTS